MAADHGLVSRLRWRLHLARRAGSGHTPHLRRQRHGLPENRHLCHPFDRRTEQQARSSAVSAPSAARTIEFADPWLSASISRVTPGLRKMRRHRGSDHDHSQPLLNHEQPKTTGSGRTAPDPDKISP